MSDTRDIVERLRTDVMWHERRGNETIAADCHEAAAEITRLRADLASLRQALGEFGNGSPAIPTALHLRSIVEESAKLATSLVECHRERDRLRAALAAQVPPPAAVPGWQWVPVEPTPAMLSAAGRSDVPEGQQWLDADARATWAAMLAASPQPPQQGREGRHALAGVHEAQRRVQGDKTAMTNYAEATVQPAVLAPLARRVGPPRRIRVSFACNDERNGMFAGRAWMAQPESLYRVGQHPWDAELVHDDWGRGVALTVDHARMRLRIHRVWFGFKAHRPMFGNWCWDAFEFERGTGKRLLALMRENGAWHCEAGPSSFYRWWNRRPNVGGEATATARGNR